jgi:anti-sigma factor RsiW
MHPSDEQLNEYLDGEAADRGQVELHLAGCRECAARLEALQALVTELQGLPEAALSRDLAAAVTRRLDSSSPALPPVPRWLRLATGLQAAAVFVAIALAAPFVFEAAVSYLPALQLPSPGEYLTEVQSLWAAWLDALSQVRAPSLPQLPSASGIPALSFLFTLAAASVVWLLGNGILLKNQIR